MTRDGGATAAKTLSIPNYFTSFARMPDGALAVSAVVAVSPAQKSALFVSHDGGASFQRNDAVPNLFALAAAGGVLYAATDNFGDGYALGASSDEGASWPPVVRFDQNRIDHGLPAHERAVPGELPSAGRQRRRVPRHRCRRQAVFAGGGGARERGGASGRRAVEGAPARGVALRARAARRSVLRWARRSRRRRARPAPGPRCGLDRDGAATAIELIHKSSRDRGARTAAAGPGVLALEAAGAALIGATGWFGGHLVFGHGVGVDGRKRTRGD